MATEDGTFDYQGRFGEEFGRTYFRRMDDLAVSSVGLGTYLGDPTDAVDDDYREAITTALESGVNVVDTAINYRCQRSERVVGEAIADADVDRDEVFVATKGGFVPFDGERPDEPGAYVREEFVESGIVDADDLARGSHAIAPEFVDTQLDWSLDNLGLDSVDLYYVHNPETQLAVRSAEVVYDQLEAAFERLEARVATGDLRAYGVATWDAFRVPGDDEQYLSLAEVVRRAARAADAVGNDASAFQAVQLPFSVVMADAFTEAAHAGSGGPTSALWFAREAGLSVFTSASIAQGALADPGTIPDAVAERLPGDTPAQRALNFARSAPGVTCALVGASDVAHVREDVAAGTFEPLGASAFDAVFE